MKHSLLKLSLFTATFSVAIIACSKKDWQPNNENNSRPVRTIMAARPDTPYVNQNAVMNDTGTITLPANNPDTPYLKISNTVIQANK